jgi:DNA-binding transcriptional regulator YiaG
MTAADFLAARKSFSLTQPEWGLMIGMSRPQVQRIENGKWPVPENARRLVEAYLSGYRPADWPVKTAK